MSDTTTVNVKNIRTDAWAAAKKSAEQADESLGSWVSRACDQLTAVEAGGRRLIPPPERLNQVAKVANPTEDPAFQRCQDYAELLARLQAAGIEAPRWLRAGLFRQVAAAAGIEPPKARPRLRQIAGDAPC